MKFPSSKSSESKTALQKLAESTDTDRIISSRRERPSENLVNVNHSVSESKSADEGKPPPMFDNPKRERRAMVASHAKGSTPERIRKLRSGDFDSISRLNIGREMRKLVSLEDLYKAVLGLDFTDMDSSIRIYEDDQDSAAMITYKTLEEYKDRQSRVLLIETMEGLRQSLSSGYTSSPSNPSQSSGIYSTAHVKIATAVRKGRDFCLLTLKRGEESSESFSLTQGDVVLLFKPNSPLIDRILKQGLMGSDNTFPPGEVLFGIIDRTKPSLPSERTGRSVQLRCLLASKDTPLGYSPGDAGTIGSEYVGIIIHSLLTVEREWDAMCALKDHSWFTPFLLGKGSLSLNERISDDRIHRVPTSGLNSSQKEAVEAVVTGKPRASIAIIQGPPGTGKSHTLVSLLKALKSNGTKKILVAAPSNAALDELMSRFVSQVGGGGVIRIGRNSTNPELSKYSLDEQVGDSHARAEQVRLDSFKQQKDKLFGDIADLNDRINACEKSQGKSDLIRTKERVKSQLESLKSWNEHQSIERDSVYKKYLDSAQFVFGTLSGFGSDQIVRNLDDKSIDVCLIDEAAQAIEVAALIPLRYNPARIVLVGDPQQLAAVVKSSSAKKSGFDMSLMERLQLTNRFRTHMLTEQYRMDPSIVEFPSEWFYGGRLQTAQSVLSRPGWAVSCNFSPKSSFLMIDVAGPGDLRQGTSLINPGEARLAVDLVRYLHDRFKVDSIGIIAPYRQQVTLIRNLLAGDSFGQQVEVDSVDAFQGREKDVIIFTCVRAGGTGDRSVGFLADQRRLNVAITRAKRAVWIIGNAEFLSANGGAVWNGLVSHCQNQNAIVARDMVETVLMSRDLKQSRHS